ncbi:DUF1822 family protein [Gloeobacter morelensis]|uniref:DUF1822 family protein n=1 Tax=Gloeobacter morelensis MG652769 TaxID=2781736 RepID=A0ABY3PHP7_9CYAN|nr:DUF1822 family protein [Gloeobacter morelensis]UFP93141.1 DUF1822 family protein [Gloeobacter morelensis MG652769]
MTQENSPLLFDDPTALCLEISEADQERAWRECANVTHPVSHWRAFRNRLTLAVLLPWIREDIDPHAAVWPAPTALSAFWDLVGGTALTANGKRWVICLDETDGTAPVHIPQEWLDIPAWAADYYLLVHLDLAGQLLRVSGWATHRQIKTLGRFDPRDRTYCVEESLIQTGLGSLWAITAGGLLLAEPTRAAMPEVPGLTVSQARALIERLGNPKISEPRLEVPFEQWAALISHDGWCQGLYAHRRGLPPQWSVLEWLKNGVSELAREAGWSAAATVGAEARSAGSNLVFFSRVLSIADKTCELCIEQITPGVWRFRLRTTLWNSRLPAGTTLRLLTENLQSFENNEVHARTAVEEIAIDLTLEEGEGIVWEIETAPKHFQREILQF